MIDQHKVFLRIALELAKLSKCQSYQVAALFVRDGRIISTGINGSPSGCKNCCEVFDKSTVKQTDIRTKHVDFSNTTEIHAEENGIIQAAYYGISLKDSVLYCTLEPCGGCLKKLIALKIKEIYYFEKYDRMTYNEYQLDMIERSKIKLINIDNLD